MNERFDNMRPEDINYKDIPETDPGVWLHIEKPNPAKKQISLRLDVDVFEWFRANETKHLSTMNRILRAYMNGQISRKKCNEQVAKEKKARAKR